MWNRLFFRFFLASWIFFVLFIALISWLDWHELGAGLSAGGFAVVIGILFSQWTLKPIQRTVDEATRQRCQAEQRLKSLEAQSDQARAILDSMVEGVCALNREGQILWVNASMQQLLGFKSAEVSGKRLVEVFRQPELEAALGDAVLNRRPAVREVQVLGPNEQTIRFQVAPTKEMEGATSLVVVAQDVTGVRKLERMRREFVANVSHELKTPLTSIKGLVETLLSGALEDAANNRRFVTLIDEDTTRLTRLIEDLLELSQIESKAAPLKLQPVVLRPFFEELEARFRNPLDAQGIVWDLTIPTGIAAVHADPDKLRQIFVNLIDNAIKFNKPGGRVTISADADAASVRVTVADTGAGIPEEDLPRIFERFYRVDKARSRELGGTGLGLSIVRHLTELHQGRVDVVSRLGRGSAFTVTMPAATARNA